MVPFITIALLLQTGQPVVRLIQEIDAAQMAREDQLAGYSVTEHYTIHNGRFGEAAELTAHVTYTKDAGKEYDVVSRSGSSTLQSTVLDRILKEETEMSRGPMRVSALITTANYRMRILGTDMQGDRRCDVVEIIPRVKSSHLLKGKIWTDAENHHLVRVEGVPAASPSFWAGNSQITREYRDIGAFAFAVRSRAVSSSLLLGKTEITIEYDGYKISDPEPASGR